MFHNGMVPKIGSTFLVGDIESDSRIIDFKGKEVEVIGLSAVRNDSIITFNHPTMGIGCGSFNECWVKPIAPKKLSGFVNVYKQGACDVIFGTKEAADEHHTRNRVACIDLSQFDEGYGL